MQRGRLASAGKSSLCESASSMPEGGGRRVEKVDLLVAQDHPAGGRHPLALAATFSKVRPVDEDVFVVEGFSEFQEKDLPSARTGARKADSAYRGGY